LTHGSYERLRDRVKTEPDEKSWITEYVRVRDRWLAAVPRLQTTRYRTQFFLNQIALGRWELELPLNVHGFHLEEHHIRNLTADADGFLRTDTAVGPYLDPYKSNSNSQTPPNSPPDPATTPQSQPPHQSPRSEDLRADPCTLDPLNDVESHLNCAAAKFDQVDRIVTGVVTRSDRAKSLWTTVIGTVWQSAWALFGFISGLPSEVWLVVAVIVALLMLLYLYRQIALGKLRESGHSCPDTPKV